jgi:hypothetical protein
MGLKQKTIVALDNLDGGVTSRCNQWLHQAEFSESGLMKNGYGFPVAVSKDTYKDVSTLQ